MRETKAQHAARVQAEQDARAELHRELIAAAAAYRADFATASEAASAVYAARPIHIPLDKLAAFRYHFGLRYPRLTLRLTLRLGDDSSVLTTYLVPSPLSLAYEEALNKPTWFASVDEFRRRLGPVAAMIDPPEQVIAAAEMLAAVCNDLHWKP